MDEKQDITSSGDSISGLDTSGFKTKPKKRSLVERELETSLTSKLTSPVLNGDNTVTSRYGRARRLKANTDFYDTDKAVSDALRYSKVEFKSQPQSLSPVYRMYASNSPKNVVVSPKRIVSVDSILENQIENIYNENISLSRFGSSEKRTLSPTPVNKNAKMYTRKDLIQSKEKEETVTMIKNMFSPIKIANKSNSHLRNILDRPAAKLNFNSIIQTQLQNGYIDNASVVKTLDFDGNKPNEKKRKNSNCIPTMTVLSKSDLFNIEAKAAYQVGDIAWARMGTYPFWPCIVTREPLSEMFVKKKLFGRIEHEIIHVTFFGDNGRRSWIFDSMLRPFNGRQEFIAARDRFTAEDKKKDPRLFAAFFISEKKQGLWNLSVDEADTLMKEPKRLRIDLLLEMLGQLKTSKSTHKDLKSSKIVRTDSDVSLSESLYDTLFSEDDGKDDNLDRSRKLRNKSLDVSEVVTACLDNMAAKTGITKIQRQSHMDRWLQKAKSKTPEKSQMKVSITVERLDTDKKDKTIEKEIKASNSKKKKKRSLDKTPPKKRYSLRKSTNESHNLRSIDNEHDYSTKSMNETDNSLVDDVFTTDNSSITEMVSIFKNQEQETVNLNLNLINCGKAAEQSRLILENVTEKPLDTITHIEMDVDIVDTSLTGINKTTVKDDDLLVLNNSLGELSNVCAKTAIGINFIAMTENKTTKGQKRSKKVPNNEIILNKNELFSNGQILKEAVIETEIHNTTQDLPLYKEKPEIQVEFGTQDVNKEVLENKEDILAQDLTFGKENGGDENNITDKETKDSRNDLITLNNIMANKVENMIPESTMSEQNEDIIENEVNYANKDVSPNNICKIDNQSNELIINQTKKNSEIIDIGDPSAAVKDKTVPPVTTVVVENQFDGLSIKQNKNSEIIVIKGVNSAVEDKSIATDISDQTLNSTETNIYIDESYRLNRTAIESPQVSRTETNMSIDINGIDIIAQVSFLADKVTITASDQTPNDDKKVKEMLFENAIPVNNLTEISKASNIGSGSTIVIKCNGETEIMQRENQVMEVPKQILNSVEKLQEKFLGRNSPEPKVVVKKMDSKLLQEFHGKKRKDSLSDLIKDLEVATCDVFRNAILKDAIVKITPLGISLLEGVVTEKPKYPYTEKPVTDEDSSINESETSVEKIKHEVIIKKPIVLVNEDITRENKTNDENIYAKPTKSNQQLKNSQSHKIKDSNIFEKYRNVLEDNLKECSFTDTSKMHTNGSPNNNIPKKDEVILMNGHGEDLVDELKITEETDGFQINTNGLSLKQGKTSTEILIADATKDTTATVSDQLHDEIKDIRNIIENDSLQFNTTDLSINRTVESLQVSFFENPCIETSNAASTKDTKVSNNSMYNLNEPKITKDYLQRIKNDLLLDSDGESIYSLDDEVALSELKKKIPDQIPDEKIININSVGTQSVTNSIDSDIPRSSGSKHSKLSKKSISKTINNENPKIKAINDNGQPIDGIVLADFVAIKENESLNRRESSPSVTKEIEPDTISLISECSNASSTKRKGRKQGNEDRTQDPEFLQYVELRQDALIDDHPELNQEEIVAYLYKTWLYEENLKSDFKKGDEMEQSSIVKGSAELPKKVKKKQTKNRVIDIGKIMYKSVKNENLVNESQNMEPDITDLDCKKDKVKRKSVKRCYIEDYSDIEDEIEMFEIFKSKEKLRTGVVPKIKKAVIKSSETTLTAEVIEVTDAIPEVSKTEETDAKEDLIEIYDEEEDYFEKLTQPKPNVFKGMVREKVCEVCERTSDLVKCKGCNGMFHIICGTKKEEIIEVQAPTRGRKKKNKKGGKGRKPKVSTDSNIDSESQSDDKSQDANVSEEMNTSVEDTTIPETIVVDADNFESVIETKMKEFIVLEDYIVYDDFYSSDDGVDWKDTVAGKCEIIDIQLKPKSQPVDNSDFKCRNCQQHDTPICFVCKTDVSPKDQSVHRQRCQVPQCHKYYHLKCLDQWPQTQFSASDISKKKPSEPMESLTCPRHVCHTCVCDDPRGCKTRFSGDKLAKCVRCPATYHTFTKCLPAGTQILTGSHIICPRHYEHRPGKVPCHVNTGWCFICALGGSLICCEYCPTSFHAECLQIAPPDGGYMCEDCETGRLPLYGEMVWVKLGHYRWWPGIVLHPCEIPENILAVKHSLGEFVVRFFGQYDHYWVNRGRVFPFQEGDSGRISSQKSKIDEAFTIAMEHAQRAFGILKNVEPNETEDLDIASSLLPPHYVKLKVNKPCGSLCGRKIDIEESSLTQCDCDPDEEDPCGSYSHCLNRMLLTECGPSCRAGDRCSNRAFEKRLYPKLTAYRTPHRGWGLKTLEDIKAGQFVIEYVGELIDEAEFRRRMARKHEVRDENYYFLTLDKERMIDAGPKGNLARFMNHCCEPNCETQKWTVLGDVRVGLFAMKDIPANSEVTFNYNLECAGIEKKRCLCGAKRCSGYIGAKPKQEERETQPKKPKLAAKRTYKKRKNTDDTSSPSTSNAKLKRPVGRPPKPRELTEIEKDLLIIRNATNLLSSDSECSRLSSVDVLPDKERVLDSAKEVTLKRKVSFNEESSSSSKRMKIDGSEGSDL